MRTHQDNAVTLRPLSQSDAPVMTALLTDPIIKKTYMLPELPDQAAAIPLFQRMLALSRDPRRYVRGICADGRLIGFLNDTDIHDGRIELGYVISPACHGQGFMTVALRSAIRELFTLGFQEVLAGAFEENKASIRVMEKCGMRRLDRTDAIEYRRTVHNCVYYSIKKQEGNDA